MSTRLPHRRAPDERAHAAAEQARAAARAHGHAPRVLPARLHVPRAEGAQRERAGVVEARGEHAQPLALRRARRRA